MEIRAKRLLRGAAGAVLATVIMVAATGCNLWERIYPEEVPMEEVDEEAKIDPWNKNEEVESDIN